LPSHCDSPDFHSVKTGIGAVFQSLYLLALKIRLYWSRVSTSTISELTPVICPALMSF
jgi:hypothetical protein